MKKVYTSVSRQLSISIRGELLDRLNAACERAGISRNKLINEIILTYLEGEKS